MDQIRPIGSKLVPANVGVGADEFAPRFEFIAGGYPLAPVSCIRTPLRAHVGNVDSKRDKLPVAGLAVIAVQIDGEIPVLRIVALVGDIEFPLRINKIPCPPRIDIAAFLLLVLIKPIHR